MTNKNLLRILFVEDLPSDAELAVLELRKEKLKFEHTTVCTRVDLIKALNEFKPDLIISDYMMPAFNGLQALKEVKEFNPEIPFILCTGSINEETAVECIKAGADDYVIKEHLTRLPFAVKEALEQHRIQIEKRAAELLLRENEEKLQSIFSAAPVGIGLVVNRVFMEVNDTFCKMTGYTRRELIGKTSEMVYPTREEYEFVGLEKNRQIAETGIGSVETRLKCKDGGILNIISGSAPLDACDLSKGLTFTVLDITQRKMAEEALRVSETKWRTLVTTIPEYIGLVDCEGKFLFLNHYAEGFSEKDTVGKSHLDFIPNEWKEFYRQKFEKCISTQKNQIFEYSAFGDNNAIRTYETCLVPIIQQGKVSNVMAIARDITERKQTEDKLRNSEERLKILFDYAPDAYYLNDLKGNFIDGNIAAEKLLGHDKNELIGKSFLKLNLLSLKQIPRAAKLLVKNALGQGTGPDEFVLSRKDGSKVTVEIITHPVKIKDQTLVLGLARDITERKKAEEALKESEEKYRRIFENVQDVFYELSIRGKILEASPSIELLSKGQFKRDDLIGKSMYDFYPDPTERRTLLNVLRERGFVSDFEINLKNRDGSSIPCSISAKIIFDVNKHPEKIIGSMHDITDRKNATEALKSAKEKAEASDKLKTTFLNNISHEVRTPLNGILGFAEIMSQADLSEEEKNLSLSMLFESSDRLLDTITNYMDISLITSRNLTLYKKYFLPEQILRELFAKNELKCSARNLELLLKIPEQTEKLSIYSDPEILSKILSHLLNNAIKFTEKGSINYGYTIHRNELEFFVKDTGTGIGKESLKSVFEHFIKEDRGPLKLTEGSGLGLSISKGLVELLGGKIWVVSERGKGSGFFFTMPVEKVFESHILVPTDVKQKESKITKSILVAEDDEINFFYLKALLKQNTSADIIHASNGREAIEKFKETTDIELVLMDIKMPVMDGLEATRQIKTINRDVPVIAITAYAMTGDENKALEAGCDGYLTKPINKKMLLEKIAEFISI